MKPTLITSLCAAVLVSGTAIGAQPSPFPSPRPTASPTATPGATPGAPTQRPALSLRGFYQGTTPAGAVALFHIQGNSNLQVHILDTANQAIHFAEGVLTDGAFSLTLNNGQTISGTAQEQAIAVLLDGQAFDATRVSAIGREMKNAGRYFGTAHGLNGKSRVTIMLDANDNIVLVQDNGGTRTGGYGTVERPVAPSTEHTFTLTQVIGGSSPVTGSFTITNGSIEGSFTNNAGTFTLLAPKDSLENRLANIATRGMVTGGQGQLIGGFIVTGGPKLVLVRAVGPSLAEAGVSPTLENPAVEVYAGDTLVGSNDDWSSNPKAAQITETGLAPNNALESALLLRLEPGAYTPVVRGFGNGTGIALVEIYELGSE